MFYYKFTAQTPFCGTDNEYYCASKEELSRGELQEMAEQYATENGESFEYLVTGWDDDEFDDPDERQEALNNYYADCCCEIEEISEEEFLENT
jgi:hypothetical protein